MNRLHMICIRKSTRAIFLALEENIQKRPFFTIASRVRWLATMLHAELLATDELADK